MNYRERFRAAFRNASRGAIAGVLACVFVYACIFILMLVSCDNGFTDFPTFFKNYTEEAAIEVMELDGEYPLDKDGRVCLSSGDDRTVTFYLRNPQHFTNELGLSYEFLGNADSAATKNLVTIFQDDQDDSVLHFVMPTDFLTEMEMGGDLSAKIELFQVLNGNNRVRDFPYYKFELYCNSEPPAVRNLTVLQYAYAENVERYVLAFNMPDMSTIHKDIVTVSVNGIDYDVDLSGAVDEKSVGVDLSFESPFVVNKALLPDLKPTGSKQSFLGATENRAVYFVTDQSLSDEVIPFEIVIKDAAGLSASSSVTAYAERLGSTTASYDSAASLSTNDDGYVPVTFYAPADNPDATVYYVVYDSAKSKIVKQGHGDASVSTKLAAGSWVIESWAHKSGFVDSYAKMDSPLVSGALYVKQSYDGSNGDSDGGKSTPWTSVDQALSAAYTAGFPSVTLILLDDLTLNSPMIVDSKFDCISVNGQGLYKFVAGESSPSGNCIEVGDGSAAGSLILSNIGVGNILVTSGSTVTVNGSTYSVGESVVSLQDEDAKLLVKSKTGSSYLNVKYQGVPEDGWTTVASATSSKLSDETLDLFVLKNDGFYLNSENGAGVIRIPGVKISIPYSDRMMVDLKADGEALAENAQGMFEVSIGQAIAASACVKKSDGKFKPITVDNMKLGLALDEKYIVPLAEGPLTVPSVRSGQYTLIISYVYEGLSYSAQILVSIKG